MTAEPRVSILIPSLDGLRGGSLARLVTALCRQSLAPLEIRVIVGVCPQGAAINQAARRARGEILVIMDDDSSIADPRLIERLVDTLDSDAAIGMAGASLRTPGAASWFQRRAAREFPRFNVPEVERTTDSDLACHGCAAIPARVFAEVRGEHEELVRGLDPDLRQRLRRAGYRVVLAPRAVVYHPLPAGFLRLLAVFFRNGRGSAYAQVHHPELIYDTDERLERRGEMPQPALGARALRFPLRIAWAVASARPLRAAAYLAYGLGYVTAWPRYYWQRRARRPATAS